MLRLYATQAGRFPRSKLFECRGLSATDRGEPAAGVGDIRYSIIADDLGPCGAKIEQVDDDPAGNEDENDEFRRFRGKHSRTSFARADAAEDGALRGGVRRAGCSIYLRGGSRNR